MTRPHNTIRTWALIAVAVTSAAMIGFGWWLISILAAPNWCNRAMGAAESAAARPEYAVGGCFQLLRSQVQALALNSHFALGTLALCLLVLVVIVLAGGRLSFTASTKGVSGNVGRDVEPDEAARFVANRADAAAEQVEEAVTPTKPKVDDPDGGS